MPVYCYTNKSGKTIERIYRIGKAPDTIKVDGSRYARNIAVEHLGFKNTPGNWPQVNDVGGLCCHPSERSQLIEYLAGQGVPTHVNKNGDCVLESRTHRKQVMKAMGYFDKSGGYGDAQPTHL